MKSLQQRLQSRISLRRNYIRQLESDIEMYKYAGLPFKAKEIRAYVTDLAQHQKLDKELYAFMLEASYDIKHLDLILDDMFRSAVIVDTPIFFGDADERN